MIGERDLQWYCIEGITKFERSPMGSMLSMQDMMSCASRKCDRCGGLGYTDEPWVMTRDWRGNEIAPRQIDSGKECPRCRGTGGVRVKVPDGGEITARPKSSHDETSREAPDDATLTRYAIVSRRLSKMPLLLSKAIQAGYGADGEANLATIRGRAWAVTPLTSAGKELLERFRGKNPDHEHAYMPVLAMTEIARQDAAGSQEKRTKLLGEAAAQARHLLAMAELSWEEQIIAESREVRYAKTA